MFSHAQTVVLCVSCSTVLAQPTGGRARLTEGEGGSLVLRPHEGRRKSGLILCTLYAHVPKLSENMLDQTLQAGW